MENFKKNYNCKDCGKDFMVMSQEAYDKIKKNKKCFECKVRSEPVREVKKENPNKILKYTYCCEARRELFERHIQPDCESCNKPRHYKKYTMDGLKLPCQEHILSDPFEGNCVKVCEHKCFINDISAETPENFYDSLKHVTCTECNTAYFDNGFPSIVYECDPKCGRKFCKNCVKNNMLLVCDKLGFRDPTPETYNCFDCEPYERKEAVRLCQLLN